MGVTTTEASNDGGKNDEGNGDESNGDRGKVDETAAQHKVTKLAREHSENDNTDNHGGRSPDSQGNASGQTEFNPQVCDDDNREDHGNGSGENAGNHNVEMKDISRDDDDDDDDSEDDHSKGATKHHGSSHVEMKDISRDDDNDDSDDDHSRGSAKIPGDSDVEMEDMPRANDETDNDLSCGGATDQGDFNMDSQKKGNTNLKKSTPVPVPSDRNLRKRKQDAIDPVSSGKPRKRRKRNSKKYTSDASEDEEQARPWIQLEADIFVSLSCLYLRMA